ncbi:hypothetical protein C7E23_15435 [Elizabethkingia anophelis]|nr:hypothetical protein C7E23_15435 [Elizabethkingia anophelis]
MTVGGDGGKVGAQTERMLGGRSCVRTLNLVLIKYQYYIKNFWKYVGGDIKKRLPIYTPNLAQICNKYYIIAVMSF